MKKFLSVFLMLFFIGCFSACSEKESEASLPAPDTSADVAQVESNSGNTPVSAEKETAAPVQNIPEKPVQQPLRMLEVLKGDHSFEEWDGEMMLSRVSGQSLLLSEKDAAAFPKLAAVLEQRRQQEEAHVEAFAAELGQLALEESYIEWEYFDGYVGESSLYVQRADEHILSIREEVYEYTGGAHGLYGTIGINLDSKTGNELLLTDVIVDTQRIPEILAPKLQEKYQSARAELSNVQEMLEDYSSEAYNWTLGYQGITFYFNPYEIASFAAGMLSATIWFDEAPELFHEVYKQQPAYGYAMAIPFGNDIELDMDPSDDRTDSLHLNRWGEDPYTYTVLEIILDGPRNAKPDDYIFTDADHYAWKMEPYLVYLNATGTGGNAKYYLYVESHGGNDFHSFHVYDLNGKQMTAAEPLYATGMSGYWWEDKGYYTDVFNNPEQFEMDTRLDILGTRSGTRMYQSSAADGMPHTYSDVYQMSENYPPLVSKIPLTITMLPQNTAEELPAGTAFLFLRTDGETYVDMALSDGRECRMEVDKSEWPMKVNGISEYDCFEDVLYAG